MDRSKAVNLAAVALKGAHLVPDAPACAVLALAYALTEADEDRVVAVVADHLARAVADLKVTFPSSPSALAAAMLAAPGITAALAPSKAPPAPSKAPPAPKSRAKPAPL